MPEEKTNSEGTENTAELYAASVEKIKTLKTEAAETKATLRKFKKANKIRKSEEIKDEKIKAEFIALEEAVATATNALEEAKAASLELKPVKQRNGGGSYTYGQIKDQETGEMRDLESSETKKWRTHARKVGKKEGIEASTVPFDPTFFDPKPAKKVKKDKDSKVEPKEESKEESKEDSKPALEPTADAPKEPEADAPKDSKKKRRSRKDK